MYHKELFGIVCSDNVPRNIAIGADGPELYLQVDRHGEFFDVTIELDPVDAGRLARNLTGYTEDKFTPVEYVALGFGCGFALTFIAFIVSWGAV